MVRWIRFGAAVFFVGAGLSQAQAESPRHPVFDVAPAFEAASAAVASYADVTQKILVSGPHGAPAFDLRRTRDALTSADQHYIVFVPADPGRMNAVSLTHLLSIHFRIVRMQNSLPLMQPNGFDIGDVRKMLMAIRAESRYLAEVFAHVARIHQAGLGKLAIASLEKRVDMLAANPTGSAKLADLVSEHRAKIARLQREFGSQFPKATGAHGEAVGMQPVDLPIVLAYADDPDVKILQEVWVPGDIAKPLVDRIDAEQAASVAKKVNPGNAKPH